MYFVFGRSPSKVKGIGIEAVTFFVAGNCVPMGSVNITVIGTAVLNSIKTLAVVVVTFPMMGPVMIAVVVVFCVSAR